MTEYIYEVGHFVREYWFRAYNTESSRHDERNTYINASYQRKCSDDDGRRQVMCFNNNLTALQTSTQTDSFARGLDFASVEYIRRNIKYSTAYALYKGRWRNQSFFGFRFESRRKRTEANFFFWLKLKARLTHLTWAHKLRKSNGDLPFLHFIFCVRCLKRTRRSQTHSSNPKKAKKTHHHQLSTHGELKITLVVSLLRGKNNQTKFDPILENGNSFNYGKNQTFLFLRFRCQNEITKNTSPCKNTDHELCHKSSYSTEFISIEKFRRKSNSTMHTCVSINVDCSKP